MWSKYPQKKECAMWYFMSYMLCLIPYVLSVMWYVVCVMSDDWWLCLLTTDLVFFFAFLFLSFFLIFLFLFFFLFLMFRTFLSLLFWLILFMFLFHWAATVTVRIIVWRGFFLFWIAGRRTICIICDSVIMVNVETWDSIEYVIQLLLWWPIN